MGHDRRKWVGGRGGCCNTRLVGGMSVRERDLGGGRGLGPEARFGGLRACRARNGG